MTHTDVCGDYGDCFSGWYPTCVRYAYDLQDMCEEHETGQQAADGPSNTCDLCAGTNLCRKPVLNACTSYSTRSRY